jgi:hypothetical protein
MEHQSKNVREPKRPWTIADLKNIQLRWVVVALVALAIFAIVVNVSVEEGWAERQLERAWFPFSPLVVPGIGILAVVVAGLR